MGACFAVLGLQGCTEGAFVILGAGFWATSYHNHTATLREHCREALFYPDIRELVRGENADGLEL